MNAIGFLLGTAFAFAPMAYVLVRLKRQHSAEIAQELAATPRPEWRLRLRQPALRRLQQQSTPAHPQRRTPPARLRRARA